MLNKYCAVSEQKLILCELFVWVFLTLIYVAGVAYRRAHLRAFTARAHTDTREAAAAAAGCAGDVTAPGRSVPCSRCLPGVSLKKRGPGPGPFPPGSHGGCPSPRQPRAPAPRGRASPAAEVPPSRRSRPAGGGAEKRVADWPRHRSVKARQRRSVPAHLVVRRWSCPLSGT